MLQEEIAALHAAEAKADTLTAASQSAVPASSKAARRAAAAMAEAQQQIAVSRLLVEGPLPQLQVRLECLEEWVLPVA